MEGKCRTRSSALPLSVSVGWVSEDFLNKKSLACLADGKYPAGIRHARHFAHLTPRAELIAVSSPVQSELDAAKKEFRHVRTYLDYDEMLRKEKTLQAVVVASATTAHAEQCIKAIERGLHVLCEKPISTSPEIVSASQFLPS